MLYMLYFLDNSERDDQPAENGKEFDFRLILLVFFSKKRCNFEWFLYLRDFNDFPLCS